MGTILVQKITWKITLDMILLETTTTPHSVYHFTNSGDVDQQGCRTPALWTINQGLFFAFNKDTNKDFGHTINNIPLDQKTRVVIEQVILSNRPTVRIYVDNAMVFQVSHDWKIPFKNVKFYLSNPWYNVAPVKILYFSYEELQTL